MELEDVRPAEIVFEDMLSASIISPVFLVVVRGQRCVMKVHHGRGPPKHNERQDRELDMHVIESTAYRRLKEQGVCEKGIVPKFFGTMDKFDPKPCHPGLDDFINDEYPPSAIFLEYIPNLEMFQRHNYTKARMDNCLMGIRKIHEALVEHGSSWSDNILVVKDDPERVVWIDFSAASTYDKHLITERDKFHLMGEETAVEELQWSLVCLLKTSIP
ncbi:hypothetical protein AJ80_01772 [Polytolypa hystricis UAMH7299]|uniref:Protein kinase domain-containing protein n=1 Tax=Polytolypa hystricis (strain UAMH7299) TaxID=1447883 RepID=A0A2B7YZP3_POLH7|nr:hypothetical protein AJ80_01772 [Polytolypa hystricis UAMH7299]